MQITKGPQSIMCKKDAYVRALILPNVTRTLVIIIVMIKFS